MSHYSPAGGFSGTSGMQKTTQEEVQKNWTDLVKVNVFMGLQFNKSTYICVGEYIEVLYT